MKFHRPTSFPISKIIIIVFVTILWVLLIPFALFISHVQANPSNPGSNLAVLESTPQPSLPENENCLACHGKPGPVLKMANGELLLIYVSPEEYATSIHGKENLACKDCHTNVGNYPHPTFTAADIRDASIQLDLICRKCHEKEYALTQDSVHATQLTAGNRNAAICTDCHSAHAVRQLIDPSTKQLTPEARVWIPNACAKCHSTIYQEYKTSAHGAALLGEGNPDVPTCIDCHGIHNIGNPTTTSFRLNSPLMCAKCHTNPKIMDKYGISTQVLNTYVADFHGTTVTLFEKQSPDAPTNKPVCFDCHGVHDIARVDDPERGLRIRENLLIRCQKCHPDANANFPDAWLSHYIPSMEKAPWVYYVNLFYKLFIPGVLGGMMVLVVLDISRLTLNRMQKPKSQRKKPSAPSPAKARPKTPPQSQEPDPKKSDEVSSNG
jgi:nitrate/TMAO reductase-like tetraheme cytochrome c subunit